MIKKLFPGIMIVFVLDMLLAGMVFKDSLSTHLSELATPEDVSGIISPETVYVDSAFN